MAKKRKAYNPEDPLRSVRAHISSQCISHCSEKEPQWETNHTKLNQKLTLIKAFLLESVERKSFAGPTDLQIRVTSQSDVSLKGAWDDYGTDRKEEGEPPCTQGFRSATRWFSDSPQTPVIPQSASALAPGDMWALAQLWVKRLENQQEKFWQVR